MPPKRPNHYEILGLTPTVTDREIKKAYRLLVKKVHPDLEYGKQSEVERTESKKRMQHINEAYETLMDSYKRREYDYTIGARSRTQRTTQKARNTVQEEYEREKFLKFVFHPARRSITKLLNQYKKKLLELEQDLFDDELNMMFAKYVDELEETLLDASNSFTATPPPDTLKGSVTWMRHSIAQAADGLEELRHFCNNYDYDHLSMAGSLFKIALEHSARAQQLTKI